MRVQKTGRRGYTKVFILQKIRVLVLFSLGIKPWSLENIDATIFKNALCGLPSFLIPNCLYLFLDSKF